MTVISFRLVIYIYVCIRILHMMMHFIITYKVCPMQWDIIGYIGMLRTLMQSSNNHDIMNWLGARGVQICVVNHTTGIIERCG